MTVVEFVQKLLSILENESDTVKWISNGTEFQINDIEIFTHKILPAYFRHEKFESFIRQLNMYGFHKVNRRKNSHIFEHQNFIQNQVSGYELIKRTKKVKTDTKLKGISMPKIDIDMDLLNQRAPKMAELLTKLIQFDTKNDFDYRKLKSKLELLSRQVSVKKEKNLRPIVKNIRQKFAVLEQVNKKLATLNWNSLTSDIQDSPTKSCNDPNEDFQQRRKIMSAPVFGMKIQQAKPQDEISLNNIHSFGSISSFIAFG